MRTKTVFLRWALILCLTATGITIVALLGWFNTMYMLDVTKLSVVILVVFTAATAWCGMLSWRVDEILEWRLRMTRAGVEDDGGAARSQAGEVLGDMEHDAEHGWFAIGLCEKLGLTGTVLGFVIMLINGFSSFHDANPEAIKKLLETLSSGMSTAFITTLVGVVCSVLLSVQFHHLRIAIARGKQ